MWHEMLRGDHMRSQAKETDSRTGAKVFMET